MCRGNGGTSLASLAAALDATEDTRPKQVPITFATYNIRNGRASRLEMALRAASQMQLDFGILTETKLTDGIYTRSSAGYSVVATDAPSKHQGGIALFYRESEYWQVESIVKHGPNVISFELVSGSRRTPIVGGYIPPDDRTTLPHITAAITRFEHHRSLNRLIIMGDLNVDLSGPSRTERDTEIRDILSINSLEDMLLHFKPTARYSHRQTWWQERGGFLIRSRCDYILGSDRRMFCNVYLKDPRCFSSDHFMVIGKLTSATRSRNRSYLRGRTRFPLRAPKWGPLTRVDTIFQALKKEVVPPLPRERRRNSWISDTTWTLVDERAAMRRSPQFDRTAYRRVDRGVKAAIKADRLRRAEEAAEAINQHLSDNNLQEAWNRTKAWYTQASDRPCAPSRADIQQVSDEYRDLYRQVEPPGDPIPVLVAPFDINDEIPTEDEIEAAVKGLRAGKAPGPTGMRADDLKAWLFAARRREAPDGTNWCRLVELVQEIYRTGVLPTEIPWSVLVLLPKDSGGYRGIGLLEIIWKVVSAIIDARIKASVEFHDALHGFRAKRGTGTAIIEAKLLQQLAAIDQVPLFEVFLDLKKAYDTLDRDRLLDVLEGYGVGPRARGLLKAFWERQRIVAKQGGYFGKPFKADRGVVQGGIDSPTHFNVLCDAVIRHWLTIVTDDGQIPLIGFGYRVTEQGALFYADDGLISSRQAAWLQWALDVLVDLFARMGLKTNTIKTKTMTCTPGYIATHQSDSVYNRRVGGGGEDFRARQRRRVECPECGKPLAAASLPQHLLSQHGMVGPSSQGEETRSYDQQAEYRVSFPPTLHSRPCPVDGCRGSATSPYNLRKHFASRHPSDVIVILQEGTVPLARCELCDMHVGARAISRSGHQRTTLCRKLAAAKRRRHAIEDARKAEEVVFTACGSPLDRVRTFRYLGRVLSDTDSDWPALYHNLAKARKRWGMLSRLLRREGCRPKVAAMFYKATVQAVLLYGSETWVITPSMLSALEGFHHRVARQLTGKVGRYLPQEDRWVYPPLNEVLAEAGLFSMSTYIARRHNRLVDYVATRPIYELCTDRDRLDGASSRRSFWWEQSWEDEEPE